MSDFDIRAHEIVTTVPHPEREGCEIITAKRLHALSPEELRDAGLEVRTADAPSPRRNRS